MSYTLDCECPRCGTRTVIIADKQDPAEPDKCPVCAERGDDVSLTIREVTVDGPC